MCLYIIHTRNWLSGHLTFLIKVNYETMLLLGEAFFGSWIPKWWTHSFIYRFLPWYLCESRMRNEKTTMIPLWQSLLTDVMFAEKHSSDPQHGRNIYCFLVRRCLLASSPLIFSNFSWNTFYSADQYSPLQTKRRRYLLPLQSHDSITYSICFYWFVSQI